MRLTCIITIIVLSHACMWASQDTLIRHARKGDPSAQREVGIRHYRSGETEFAMRWLEKALDGRDSIAPYYMGLIYRNGYSNIYEMSSSRISPASMAFKYFHISAQMGYPPAQHMAGMCLINGTGVSPDRNEGMTHIKRAADAGYTPSVKYMERMAHVERQVSIRLSEDMYLMSSSYSPDEIYAMGYMYYKGLNVPPDTAIALTYLKHAADAGVGDAAFYVAQIYMDTLSPTGADFSQGIKYLSIAAEKDVTEAQFAMGLALFKGEHTAQDYRMAAYWFSRGAENGNGSCMANLGYMYYKGYGVEKNMESAMKWLEGGAEKDIPAAHYTLGVIYLYGENGMERNYEKAFSHISHAANMQYPVAMYAMGLLYEQGDAVPADAQKSVTWYERARNAGYTRADKHLMADM